MTRQAKPAVHVKGSRQCQAGLGALDKDSDEYRAVDEALSVLKANVLAGLRVPKAQWPKAYVRRYRINSLYKLNVPDGRRLTYTLVAENQGCSVIVLDYFRSHKEYDEFFGY